jgi:hypothetical protein
MHWKYKCASNSGSSLLFRKRCSQCLCSPTSQDTLPSAVNCAVLSFMLVLWRAPHSDKLRSRNEPAIFNCARQRCASDADQQMTCEGFGPGTPGSKPNALSIGPRSKLRFACEQFIDSQQFSGCLTGACKSYCCILLPKTLDVGRSRILWRPIFLAIDFAAHCRRWLDSHTKRKTPAFGW